LSSIKMTGRQKVALLLDSFSMEMKGTLLERFTSQERDALRKADGSVQELPPLYREEISAEFYRRFSNKWRNASSFVSFFSGLNPSLLADFIVSQHPQLAVLILSALPLTDVENTLGSMRDEDRFELEERLGESGPPSFFILQFLDEWFQKRLAGPLLNSGCMGEKILS